jgi:hypothetical protein
VPLPLFVPGSSESAQESATGARVSVAPADALVTSDAVTNPTTKSASNVAPETERLYVANRLYMAAGSSLPGMSGGSPVCDQSRSSCRTDAVTVGNPIQRSDPRSSDSDRAISLLGDAEISAPPVCRLLRTTDVSPDLQQKRLLEPTEPSMVAISKVRREIRPKRMNTR